MNNWPCTAAPSSRSYLCFFSKNLFLFFTSCDLTGLLWPSSVKTEWAGPPALYRALLLSFSSPAFLYRFYNLLTNSAITLKFSSYVTQAFKDTTSFKLKLLYILLILVYSSVFIISLQYFNYPVIFPFLTMYTFQISSCYWTLISLGTENKL